MGPLALRPFARLAGGLRGVPRVAPAALGAALRVTPPHRDSSNTALSKMSELSLDTFGERKAVHGVGAATARARRGAALRSPATCRPPPSHAACVPLALAPPATPLTAPALAPACAPPLRRRAQSTCSPRWTR